MSLLEIFHLGFPLIYKFITFKMLIAALNFGQCFFKKHNPKLSSLFIGLAEYSKTILINWNVIVNNNFFNNPIYS